VGESRKREFAALVGGTKAAAAGLESIVYRCYRQSLAGLVRFNPELIGRF
jgi:hypothetical protein